jgi:type IV pilus assembly protein PilA
LCFWFKRSSTRADTQRGGFHNGTANDAGRDIMSFSRSLIARSREEDEGFTLIELMVVVLIIAILIAIAIPTFLGARQRAQDRAAQSDLRNGLTAEKTIYTDGQTYLDSQSAANVTTLKGVESSLNWSAAASTATRALSATVGQSVVAADTVCLSETSKSGTVFAIGDIATGTSAGTYYGKGAACPNPATTAFVSGMGSSW